MPLELAPLTEDDLHEYCRIKFAAFGTGPLGRILTPTLTPERYEKAYQADLKSFHKPTSHYLKVTDTETGKIIAGAKWQIFPDGRTLEEVQKDVIPFEPMPDSNVEGEKFFLAYLNDNRYEYMNTKAIVCKYCVDSCRFWLHFADPNFQLTVLNILVTDPDHHRRGAGAIHMKWGMEQADKLGLPSYLEASEAGKPLYERFGFETVKEVFFDLEKFGVGKGFERNSIMLRSPQKPTKA